MVGAAHRAPGAQATTRPVHLFAGDPASRGRWRDPALAAALAASGAERPSVAYVGAASGDDRSFFRWISEALERAGAGEVRLAALASRRADVEAAKATIAGSDVVFVSGGDVEAGMACLDARGAVGLLRGLAAAGKAFVGLSAGSIMLAERWVRWPDEHDDASTEAFPCLGIAPVVCDTHAEADDWEELRALLELDGAGVGYGIPSGGALRVEPDGSVAAVGRAVHRLERRRGDTLRLADLEPA